MYQTFCQTLLHMTWTAAIAALAVMALRLVLHKAPRAILCALWLAVLLRMVCPVSFTLPVSLVPEAPSVPLPAAQTVGAARTGQTGPAPDDLPVTEDSAPAAAGTADPARMPHAADPYEVLFAIWLAGCAGMLLWAGASYGRLRRRVAEAVRVEDNVYESDRIDGPFVCGVFRPRVYLPVGLSGEDRKYVLLHERAHIARKDHIVKPLAWLALSVHWFNPVLWAAYWLYGRDVETACDQRVIRAFDRGNVAGYASALLHLGRRNAAPRAVPLAFGEENAKGRIRHVMDFKHPHLLVLLAAAVVCAIVGVLLLANPEQRGDQIDGVRLTEIRVLDQGVPVELPEDLGRAIIPLIRQYDKGDYSDLFSYQDAPGDVVLSDQGGGTVFNLTDSLDRELVLVRNNHDGYSWATARKGTTLTGLRDDPAYRVWEKQVEDYLATGRARELYALKTPYIGNQVAVGNILKALNVSEVVGPYTIELTTEKEPYGVTLHLENLPGLETELTRTAGYLHQAGTLFVALVDNASFFHWDYVTVGEDGQVQVAASSGVQPGMQKPVTQETFQMLYTAYRDALGGYSPSALLGTARYSLGNALYLSPEMPWRDMPFYTGSVTVSQDLFSVQLTHVLSSAMPQISDTCANPVYSLGTVPEELPLKDDTWPSQQYLELAEAQEPPLAVDGILDLGAFQARSCLVVCDQKGIPTPYRLYRLDGETWLSHETAGVADWVFRLTAQPDLPAFVDETEE